MTTDNGNPSAINSTTVEDAEPQAPEDFDAAAVFASFVEDDAPADVKQEAKEAGEILKDVTTSSARVIRATQSTLDPSTLKGRVALSKVRMDNTASMGQLYRIALQSHDLMLDEIARRTTDEPVQLLVSTSLLNPSGDAPDSLVYGYTPIETAPRFGTPGNNASYGVAEGNYPMAGLTGWRDAFAEDLAATAQQVSDLEAAGKTVYGMIGLMTDGLDNASIMRADELAKLIRSYRRMGNVAPYAVYCGPMPKPGEPGYEAARQQVLHGLRHDGSFDPELENASLEQIIRGLFAAHGFDPKLVFLPGDDMKELLKAIVEVSKLMVTVSQGKKLDLTDL